MKRNTNFLNQSKNTRPKVKTKTKTDNKDYVLSRVIKDATYIRFVSDRLKDDKEVVMTAMGSARLHQQIFKYASKRLQSQHSVILKAVSRERAVYKSLPEIIRFKKQITLAAVLDHGASLRFTSNNLKNDYQIVRAAVCNSGCSIKYASKRLKDNKKLALLAVKSSSGGLSGSELLYISSRLKNDKEVCLQAVKESSSAIRHVPEKLKVDPEIAIQALSRSAYNATFFHPYTLLQLNLSNLSKSSRDKIFHYFIQMLDINDPFISEIILSYGKEKILNGLDIEI